MTDRVQERADLRRARRPTVDAAIVSAATLSRGRKPIIWLLMAALWLFSAAGTVLAALLVSNGSLAGALIGAAVWQAVCSVVQWIFASTPGHPLYLVALVGSLAPSVVGYWAYGGAAVVGRVGGSVFVDLPSLLALEPSQIARWLLAALVYVVVLAAADILPERTLIKH